MSKKRRCEEQLTKNNYDDEPDVEPEGPMPVATPEEMAKRNIVRIKRRVEPTASSTGGLFSGINTSGPSMTAVGASMFGGSAGSAAAPTANLFQPMKAVPLAPPPAGKDDDPESPVPAAEGFNFTAPTSFGQKFAPPSTSPENSTFPPLQAGAGFDNLASAFQPAGSPAADAPVGFSFTAKGENKMAKLGQAASKTDLSADAPATTVFTPTAPAYKKVSGAETFVAAETVESPAENSNEDTVLTLPQAMLKEATPAKDGWDERGVGALDIRESKGDKRARIIMWHAKTKKVLLNAPLDASLVLATKTLTNNSAFVFVSFDPETKSNRTYRLSVKKDTSIAPLFDELLARLPKKN